MAKLNGVKVIDMVAGKIEKVAFEGAEYVRVDDVLSATSEDIALCVKGWGYQNSGEYYEVVESFEGSDRVYVSVNGNYGGRCVCHDNDVEIFRKVTTPSLESRVEALESDVAALKGGKEAEDEPLKVGDYAKVIKDVMEFREGNIVQIASEMSDSGFDYKVDFINVTGSSKFSGQDYGYIAAKNVVRATDAEVAEAKAALAPKAPEFSVGDYAKVVGETRYNDIKAGTTVKVTKDIDGDDEYKIKLLDDSDYDYAKPASLEKVSAEEAAAKAKWAEIGREVDEYKEGDIVRVNVVGLSRLNSGDIGTITEFEGSAFRVETAKVKRVNWMQADRVELVTPVESRFDR